MKPTPLTDEEIMYMYNEPCSDAEAIAFAREVEAAVNAKWERELAIKEEHDFWTGVCESLDMEIAGWRVSYNNGKTWTIWETDPQPSMFDTKAGMIVHPLYVPKRYAENYPASAKREHITDGTPCWCNPELNYVDPITGAEVWVHKEPQ